MKRKFIITLFLAFAILFISNDTYAYDVNNYRYRELCGKYEVAEFKEDGSITALSCHAVYTDAKEALKTSGDNAAVFQNINGQVRIVNANVAMVDLTVNPETLTYFYNNMNLTGSAYTYMDTGSLYGGVDSPLVQAEYSDQKQQWVAKVKLGNYTGWIAQHAFEIVPLAWVKSSSSYTVTAQDIRHNYVAKIQNPYYGSSGRTIGPKPEMLEPGTYYSYDGHYFYKDLRTLIIDTQNNTYENAVNKDNEYYNYYMYLSNHTRTNYSSININEYIKNNLGIRQDAYGKAASSGTSRLYGMGTFFYHAQEKYGVNAILSLSLSRNETGNGTSYLAINKNNGFGLNAVDSNPIHGATWYPSFSYSIMGYALKWITYGYAHPRDWRYFGPQFGDKLIGMNVKYASDTYWSEKMASNYYALDKALGLQDYNYYQLGVVKNPTDAYSQPSTASKWLYVYPEKEDAVVIVGEVEVNGELWYEIVSDLNLDDNYNENWWGDYNWDKTVYVKASNVKKINKAKNGYVSPNDIFEYPDRDYEYHIYIEKVGEYQELVPKVAISTKNAAYYEDPLFEKATGEVLQKGRYVMVYTTALLNNEPVAYLVTSDYHFDQKHWVTPDSIEFKNVSYGRVEVSTESNQFTWVNSNTQDVSSTLISGLYTYTYVPVLSEHKVGNDLWYKVPVNIKTSGNEFGYTLAEAPNVKIYLSPATVENKLPIINAVDKTFVEGETFDERKDVTATDEEDGDLTEKIEIVENTVNPKVPGTYKVTYKVKDTAEQETTKTITITVLENKAPVINVSDQKIMYGQELKVEVTATDEEDGDLTKEIKEIENTVKTDTIGIYKIIYQVTDSKGKTTTKEVKVEVTDRPNPIINAEDIVISIGKEFDELNGVSAIDSDGKNITSSIKVEENDVNTKIAGTYKVTYKVTDSYKKTTTKTIKVYVIEKVVEKKDAIFFFDYLKEVNGKLEIKGYNTINGIDNNLDIDITYKLLFVRDSDKKEYTIKLTRITDKAEITRPVYSTDSFDYTYSWFKGTIDTDKIPDGDYKIYVTSETDEYMSKSLVTNKVLRNQISEYKDSKYVLTRNNYLDNDLPLELIVRTEKIGNKNATSYYNQYNQYRKLEFTNNKLRIMGNSYSYGMDLSKSRNVERKIIFENTNTFEKYTYDLGYIDNGMYQVGNTLNDNFDKTRAWFDKTIDISELKAGTYAIYITNKSNIEDYGELNELLLRDLSTVKTTINSKEYSFSVNKDKRYRIELTVK